MSDPLMNADSEWAALDGDCLVYRAVLKPAHVDRHSGRVLKAAFLRRSPKEDGTPRDVKGLSVLLADYCTVEDIRNRFSVNAVCSLTVSQVRAVTDTEPFVDVVRDKVDHANITGLPAYGEDVFRAENLASELASCCIPVYIKVK